MANVTRKVLTGIYKKRDPRSRKYDFGYLLVIGGSEYYSGAPALNAMAAFRAGVDMVRVVAPKRASDLIASFSPNLATVPLEGKILTKEHLDTLIEEVDSIKAVSNGKCAVLIGGGISRSHETMETVADFLAQIDVPTVVDAEAIHALEKRPEVVRGKKFLLTPHAYEFFIMTGKKVAGLSVAERAKIVKEEAARMQTTIVLKGELDFISDGKQLATNPSGCALMTKGGLGDTLAGIAGALAARGVAMFDVACAAAYINGAAGELAGKKFGEGMLATDLLDMIPSVLPRVSYISYK